MDHRRASRLDDRAVGRMNYVWLVDGPLGVHEVTADTERAACERYREHYDIPLDLLIEVVDVEFAATHCNTCEHCTWNRADCNSVAICIGDHPHCRDCGHCLHRHVAQHTVRVS